MDDDVVKGRGVLHSLADHPFEVVADGDGVVVAGDGIEVVDLVEVFTVVELEVLGIYVAGVAGGFFDVLGGLGARRG